MSTELKYNPIRLVCIKSMIFSEEMSENKNVGNHHDGKREKKTRNFMFDRVKQAARTEMSYIFLNSTLHFNSIRT